jgi:dTDP-4-dehydrorhamnose 3,5-epimerase-like enzyme
MPIDIKPLAIPEVKPISPPIFRNARGFFYEACNREALAAAGIGATFVQGNPSLSRASGDKDRRLPRLRDLPAYFTYPSS